MHILTQTGIAVVNASVEPHSYRLESVGGRVYKTYYEHSSKYIQYALTLIKNDMGLYLERKENILRKLKKYAIQGNDIKYASLLTDNGYYFLRIVHDYKKAHEYFQQAYSYSPAYELNLQYLMEANFQLKDFDNAYTNAVQLIDFNYPNRHTALKYGIHCALEAGFFTEAAKHCETYLVDFPDDELIQVINKRLETSSNIGELKIFFAKGYIQKK